LPNIFFNYCESYLEFQIISQGFQKTRP